MNWRIRGTVLNTEKPLIMGIVNVTPDSFYDGGRYAAADKAIAHGLKLAEEGADLLDIGGESTRPGSSPVPEEEELKRVMPVIERLAREVKIPISVDTCKSAVAEKALAAGAQIVNDISALRFDRRLAEVVRSLQSGLVLMHMQGTPRDMQSAPCYCDTIAEIYRFLEERLEFCTSAGIEEDRLAVDPGIGFGKRLEDNLLILNRLSEFKKLNRPLLVGASRKSFLGKITGLPAEERLEGSLAAAVIACVNGANILRVHDVKETKQALEVAYAIVKSSV